MKEDTDAWTRCVKPCDLKGKWDRTRYTISDHISSNQTWERRKLQISGDKFTPETTCLKLQKVCKLLVLEELCRVREARQTDGCRSGVSRCRIIYQKRYMRDEDVSRSKR